MKVLAGLLTLSLSVVTFANTIDSQIFLYDGSVNSTDLLLNAKETQREFTSSDSNGLCKERLFVGTRLQCHSMGPMGKARGPHRHCHRVNEYKTVSYTCPQTIKAPKELKIFDVQAKVKLNIVGDAKETKEFFKVTLEGKKLSLKALSSGKKHLILLKDRNVNMSVSGTTKTLDVEYDVELVDAAVTSQLLTMTELSVDKNNALIVSLGKVSSVDEKVLENIGLAFNISQKIWYKVNPTVFDRELLFTDVNFEVLQGHKGPETFASVELNKFDLPVGKFKIQATTFFNPEGEFLNESQFEEELGNSKAFVYSNR